MSKIMFIILNKTSFLALSMVRTLGAVIRRMPCKRDVFFPSAKSNWKCRKKPKQKCFGLTGGFRWQIICPGKVPLQLIF